MGARHLPSAVRSLPRKSLELCSWRPCPGDHLARVGVDRRPMTTHPLVARRSYLTGTGYYAPASPCPATAARRRSSTVTSSSPSSSRRASTKVARWTASRARKTRPWATSQAISQTRRVISHSSHRDQSAAMSLSASASRSSRATPSARSLMSTRHDSTRDRREDTRTRADRIRRSISGAVPLSSVARSTADVSRYSSVPETGSVPIAANLVEQSGRCTRGQPEPPDLPGPVPLGQARAGEFPPLGQGLQSFLDGQPGASVPVRGAQLSNDFVAVRDQHGFAGPDQSDVLRETGLELLHANGLHAAMVVTGGHRVNRTHTPRPRIARGQRPWAQETSKCRCRRSVTIPVTLSVTARSGRSLSG